jgi:hypothetical protein
MIDDITGWTLLGTGHRTRQRGGHRCGACGSRRWLMVVVFVVVTATVGNWLVTTP